MVNIFSVTSGKLFECHFCDIGKEFHCQSGKLIQCHVVNFFIDIHTLATTQKDTLSLRFIASALCPYGAP